MPPAELPERRAPLESRQWPRGPAGRPRPHCKSCQGWARLNGFASGSARCLGLGLLLRLLARRLSACGSCTPGHVKGKETDIDAGPDRTCTARCLRRQNPFAPQSRSHSRPAHISAHKPNTITHNGRIHTRAARTPARCTVRPAAHSASWVGLSALARCATHQGVGQQRRAPDAADHDGRSAKPASHKEYNTWCEGRSWAQCASAPFTSTRLAILRGRVAHWSCGSLAAEGDRSSARSPVTTTTLSTFAEAVPLYSWTWSGPCRQQTTSRPWADTRGAGAHSTRVRHADPYLHSQCPPPAPCHLALPTAAALTATRPPSRGRSAWSKPPGAWRTRYDT